jgi:hypothetical protein
MMENLALDQLLKALKQIFAEFPDVCTGSNVQYEVADAGMGHFRYLPNILGMKDHRSDTCTALRTLQCR